MDSYSQFSKLMVVAVLAMAALPFSSGNTTAAPLSQEMSEHQKAQKFATKKCLTDEERQDADWLIPLLERLADIEAGHAQSMRTLHQDAEATDADYSASTLRGDAAILYRLVRRVKKCPEFQRQPWNGTFTSTAPAQTDVPAQTGYLRSGWTALIGGNVGVGQSWNHYEDLPRFDGDGWNIGGSAAARYYFASGWFVAPEVGGMALGVNGTNPDGAFAKIGSMTYEGGQAGYSLSAPGATPLNVYVGAAAAQAGVSVGIDTRSFSESMSKTLNGWTVHTGFEFQPAPVSAPNWWMGVDYRYVQVCGDIGGDPVSARMHLISVTGSYQFSLGH